MNGNLTDCIECGHESVASPRRIRWKWLPKAFRISAGVVLLAAGCLKAFSPIDWESFQITTGLSALLLACVIQLELLLGILLVAGVGGHWLWRAATGLFASFCLFSLYRAVAGFDSCGCFGPVKVHPWLTAILDLMFLVGLVQLRNSVLRDRMPESTGRTGMLALGAYCILGVAAMVSMVSTAEQGAEGIMPVASERGGLVVLEPDKWVGKAFPLRDSIDVPDEVFAGRTILVLYHHDCPKCQEAIPKYKELARSLGGAHAAFRLSLIEVPPFGSDITGTEERVFYARLTDDREWFVQTPMEIELKNGVVESASTELPSLRASGSIDTSLSE